LGAPLTVAVRVVASPLRSYSRNAWRADNDGGRDIASGGAPRVAPTAYEAHQTPIPRSPALPGRARGIVVSCRAELPLRDLWPRFRV